MTKSFCQPPALSDLLNEFADEIQRISDYPASIYADRQLDLQAFVREARGISRDCFELESAEQSADDFNPSHLEDKDDF